MSSGMLDLTYEEAVQQRDRRVEQVAIESINLVNAGMTIAESTRWIEDLRVRNRVEHILLPTRVFDVIEEACKLEIISREHACELRSYVEKVGGDYLERMT